MMNNSTKRNILGGFIVVLATASYLGLFIAGGLIAMGLMDDVPPRAGGLLWLIVAMGGSETTTNSVKTNAEKIKKDTFGIRSKK